MKTTLRRYRKGVKKAVKSARKTRVATATKQYVKRVIHAQIEKKQITNYSANQPIAFAGSVTLPSYITLHPAINQSPTVNGRTGNKVNVTSGMVRGFVNLNSTSAFSSSITPINVKMWLCRRRGENATNTLTAADFSNFFQAGSTSLGFQSNVMDMLFKPNNDVWQVFATKTCILSPLTNLPATTAVGTALPVILPTGQGKVQVPFYFNIGKHLGKLIFNDSNNQPQNTELYLVFQAVNIDGTAPASLTLQPEFNMVSECLYEDA